MQVFVEVFFADNVIRACVLFFGKAPRMACARSRFPQLRQVYSAPCRKASKGCGLPRRVVDTASTILTIGK